MNELRSAIRQIQKHPGFSFIAVLTLSLCIGVNTSVFNVVYALLWRPLPVSEPHRLLAIGFSDRNSQPASPAILLPFVREFQKSAPAFEQLSGFGRIKAKLQSNHRAERIAAELVTENYFALLGITPAIGKIFSPSTSQETGQDFAAVLSYECWRDRFNQDPHILGRTFKLNDCAVTVIGVAPSGFRGLDQRRPVELWLPATMERPLREQPFYNFVGRPRHDATRAQALGELNDTIRRLGETYGSQPLPGYEKYGTFLKNYLSATLTPAALGSWGPYSGDRTAITRLGGISATAVFLVLLIACANLTSLLLERTTSRRRELAIRMALGASRWRLLRQLLVEGLLLALAGAAVGIFVSHAINQLVLKTRSGDLAAVPLDLSFGWEAFSFTLFVTMLSGLFFSLLPAIRASHLEVGASLKNGASGAVTGGSRYSLQHALVTIQISVSLVLLISSGLCLQSFVRLITADVGFDTDKVAFLVLSLPDEIYTPERMQTFVAEAKTRISRIPGIESVSLSDANVPLSGDTATLVLQQLEGFESHGEPISFLLSAVGSGYFQTTGTPLISGREFTAADRAGSPPVALVNESFVRRYWPGSNPLGRRVADREIVGVVHDTHTEQLWTKPSPHLYTPFAQVNPRYAAIVIRAISQPENVLASMQQAAQSVEPNAEIQANTPRRLMHASLRGHNLLIGILSIFATSAVLLAALGVYGVVAYMALQRTHEIGIRIALGAQHGKVIGMLIHQGMKPVWIGIGIGIIVALGATQLLRNWLYGLSPTDPITFVSFSALLAVIALLACWLPGRRATKADPIIVLRSE